MRKIYLRRAAIIIFLGIMTGIICKVFIVPQLTLPKSTYQRDTLKYQGFLIGKPLDVSIKHYVFNTGIDMQIFGTDIDSEKIVSLLERQLGVEKVYGLGRWPDGTDRYLVLTANQRGYSFIELYALNEAFSNEENDRIYKSLRSYILQDGSIYLSVEEESYKILFPAVLRTEAMNSEWEKYSVYDELNEGMEYELFLPEESPFKNVFDLLYDFYENAALYKVDSRSENELIVSFNDKSMELNTITAPEQSDIVTRIYKGRFKITIRLESGKIKARVVLLNDNLKR